MARRINASTRSDLQRGLVLVRKDMEKLTRDLSGADSQPVKKSAQVLQRNWRRLLNTPGNGEPSAPGAPPRRQIGQVRRSIRQAVVEGVRRVGSGLFIARLLEYGTDKMPPRPHGRVAGEVSAPEMTEVVVTASQQQVAKAVI